MLILDFDFQMPFKRKHEVFEYFKYAVEKQINKCQICGIELVSTHVENLMRHLKSKHSDIYDELNNTGQHIFFSINNSI